LIIHGDSLEELRALADESIDAVVTDPPYGLGNTSPAQVAECLKAWSAGETWTPKGSGFMGKSWDAWVPPPELWREVFRVLKHGGHALVFAGSRTQDLMSISLRLAGFEVRDALQWLYGSGFPKNHNVSKAIDRENGLEGEIMYTETRLNAPSGSIVNVNRERTLTTRIVRKPASQESEQWKGWGTALKPAYEPCILVRKPLSGSVAQNVLNHGTGALNIDACRVGNDARVNQPARNKAGRGVSFFSVSGMPQDAQARACVGRYPANVILDEEAALALD